MQNLKEWLDFDGKTQVWLARTLKENPNTVSSWVTGRVNIPGRHEKKLRELGYQGPMKRARQEAVPGGVQSDLLVQMDLRVANLKGYMEAQFKAAHDEREILAEILRALAERLDDVAVKVGLESLKPGRASRKTG